MMTSFGSPISLERASIVSASFNTFGEHWAGERTFSLNLGRPDPRPLQVHDNLSNRTSLDYQLSVRYSLYADGNQEDLSLDLTVVLLGAVSVADDDIIDIPEAEVLDWLEANAVSLLYAKARAYVEYISSMSPFGTCSLPTIDPYAFLEAAATEVGLSEASDER